ncbi:MAG: 4Fe-4S binding protein [Coriobacteriia bacterium]|nr:4Fe-4S binding protein [Coriobacteriia bacterium]
MPERLRRVVDIATSRIVVRSAFLAFFVWICVQLMLFVRWAEGVGPYVPRPEAVAGLLPVGHFTSFFAWVRGGGWDYLLPAGLVIIIGAITLSLLFKRGFCGWICPLGTVWELGALLGRALLGRNIRLPKWLDLMGRGVRYTLSAMILVWLMSVGLPEAVGFRELPYMWTADIKIISGFGNPLFIVAGLLAFALSMLFSPVWCRYLCPLGGWYSVLGIASPCAVEREESLCIHCNKCTKVCHALVDVENVRKRVWAPECDGCMDCVRVCPAPGALDGKLLGLVRISPRVWAVLVVGVWLAIFLFAKATGNWDTTVPTDAFRTIIRSGALQERTPGGL